MLAEEQKVILSTGEFDFNKEEFVFNNKTNYHFPRKIHIDVPQEMSLSLEVKKILEAQDMLDNFHPVIRLIAKYFLRLKPGYFRLVSDFDLQVKQQGNTIKETGTTLHEIVMFAPVHNRE